MRISDWSSDVCSSDLLGQGGNVRALGGGIGLAGCARKPTGELRRCEKAKIGRASCRERVCVRVDLGGRRIIKKQKTRNPHRTSNAYTHKLLQLPNDNRQ